MRYRPRLSIMLRNSRCIYRSSNHGYRNCRSRIPPGLINTAMSLSISRLTVRYFNRIYNLNRNRILDHSLIPSPNIRIQERTTTADLNRAKNIKAKPAAWLKISQFSKKIPILLNNLKQWLRSQSGRSINMANWPLRNKLDIELLRKLSLKRKNFGQSWPRSCKHCLICKINRLFTECSGQIKYSLITLWLEYLILLLQPLTLSWSPKAGSILLKFLMTNRTLTYSNQMSILLLWSCSNAGSSWICQSSPSQACINIWTSSKASTQDNYAVCYNYAWLLSHNPAHHSSNWNSIWPNNWIWMISRVHTMTKTNQYSNL